MIRTRFLALAVIVTFGLLIAVGASDNTYATNNKRYIVSFNSGVDDNKKKSEVNNAGAAYVQNLDIINGAVIESSDIAVLNKLKKSGLVKYVNEDMTVSAYRRTTTPIQPSQTTPWGISQINADDVWSVSQGSGVKVAVIDTGIDKTHPDLIQNIKGGINFVKINPRKPIDPSAWGDDNGHGTHVAGTIAAANNTIGVVGVAPAAQLYAVKVLSSTGSGYLSDVISGIQWAMNNGMNVVNMSLGADTDVQAMHDAADAAYNAGVVLVAAAGNVGDGNLGTEEVGYPAKYSSVIAVAATDSVNNVAYFSSDGSEVELSAPGVNVYSTLKGGSYGTMSGTSMASPHVAGAVASLLATTVGAYDVNDNGKWDPSEVRASLDGTADDLGMIGKDNFYGYGLVNLTNIINL